MSRKVEVVFLCPVFIFRGYGNLKNSESKMYEQLKFVIH